MKRLTVAQTLRATICATICATAGIDFMEFILSANLWNKEIFANFTIIYKIERAFKEVQIP